MSDHSINFQSTAAVTAGDCPPGDPSRPGESKVGRTRSGDLGDRACPGCGEALGARHAIDAAIRASRNQVIAVNATGCLELFSTPHLDTSRRIPWMHSLLGNAAAVASGVAAAMRARGRPEVRVLAQGGDGGTADAGFGCLSGMFERNDDVLYVCYDNEGCMNTGGQRSSATPPAARTASTPALGAQPGNAFGTGKNVPLIAMAHRIPYVATASVADLPDFEAKIARAMAIRGARYVHVHVPCPLGWGTAPADTVRIARLAIDCGLFPLFEAERGEITGRSPIVRQTPASEYLKLQKRFAHLFGDEPDVARIAQIQAIADRNIAYFGLTANS